MGKAREQEVAQALEIAKKIDAFAAEPLNILSDAFKERGLAGNVQAMILRVVARKALKMAEEADRLGRPHDA